MNVLEMDYRETSPVAWKRRPFQRAPRVLQREKPTLVGRSAPEVAWKSAVEARLQKLAGYKSGWDGYNAKPPRSTVIVFARDILASVMTPTLPAPSIVPLSGGGLQLEWHTGGLDVELTIYRPYEAELCVEFDDGRDAIEEEPLSMNFERLGALLAELA